MSQFVKLLMLVPNSPGAKLSGAKLSCAKVSAFTIFVPNSPFCVLGAKLSVFLLGGKLSLLLFLCLFVPYCSGVKLSAPSGCRIVLAPRPLTDAVLKMCPHLCLYRVTR